MPSLCHCLVSSEFHLLLHNHLLRRIIKHCKLQAWEKEKIRVPDRTELEPMTSQTPGACSIH